MLALVWLMAGACLTIIVQCLWLAIRKEPCHPAFGWWSCKQGKCSTCEAKRGGKFRAVKTPTVATAKEFED